MKINYKAHYFLNRYFVLLFCDIYNNLEKCGMTEKNCKYVILSKCNYKIIKNFCIMYILLYLSYQFHFMQQSLTLGRFIFFIAFNAQNLLYIDPFMIDCTDKTIMYGYPVLNVELFWTLAKFKCVHALTKETLLVVLHLKIIQIFICIY